MSENLHDKMPSHNIDDLFRSAIEPMDESPSTSVWENLEKDLDRHSVINIKRKYNNLKRVAVVLVLILSGALVYEFQTRFNTGKGYTGIQDANNLRTGNNSTDKNNETLTKSELPTSSSDGKAIAPETFNQLSLAEQQLSATATVNDNLSLPGKESFSSSKEFFDRSAAPGTNVKTESINKSTSSSQTQSGYLIKPGSKISDDNNSLTTDKSIATDKALATISNNPQRSLISKLPSLVNINRSDDILTGKLTNGIINISTSNKLLAIKDQLRSETAASKQAIKLSDKKSRFALSLIFSPDFTSRFIKEDWLVNREDSKEEIRKSERNAFSYSLGALVDYKLGTHWGIQSGFTLSRAVINFEPKFIFARRDEVGDVKYKFNSSSGYSYFSPHTMSAPPAFGDSLHAFGSYSSLLYLSVPVAATYTVTKKKFDFHATAGIAANILIKDKIETSLFRGGNHETAVNHDIRGLKPVYYSALLGAGVSYKLNNALAVTFTPTARVALNSLNKDGPVRSYQQSLGMVAGVRMSF